MPGRARKVLAVDGDGVAGRTAGCTEAGHYGRQVHDLEVAGRQLLRGPSTSSMFQVKLMLLLASTEAEVPVTYIGLPTSARTGRIAAWPWR